MEAEVSQAFTGSSSGTGSTGTISPPAKSVDDKMAEPISMFLSFIISPFLIG